MNNNPISYEKDERGHFVTYRSPIRKFGNLREELNNDVKLINNTHGKVYVAFSSGVDSQVILRCFLDMKGDFEPFFMHVKGLNDFELNMVRQSEKFYGISIKILEIDINQFKDQWLTDKIVNNLQTLIHHPFEWASKQLPENYPMIMSGANEPAIIGTDKSGIHIYHNADESLNLRFKRINQSRTILDFPYSSESLASYYCDELIKTWCDVCNYYITNGLVTSDDHKPVDPGSRFNYYLKGFIKGKYFKKDILWPAKKSGYENYPNWMIPHFPYTKEANISANYNNIVEHLELCNGTLKEFRGWNF